MSTPEFDQYAADYDRVLADSLPEGMNESGYFAEYKVVLLAQHLRGKAVQRVLDFGCGAGRSLPYLRDYLPQAEHWGYDVSPESLKFAAQRVPTAQLRSDWNELASQQFGSM